MSMMHHCVHWPTLHAGSGRGDPAVPVLPPYGFYVACNVARKHCGARCVGSGGIARVMMYVSADTVDNAM